jgi:hypothetical protein
MVWSVCRIAIVLLVLSVDAAAGPILLSSGRIGGSINPHHSPADANVLETQELVTTSWVIDAQDSAGASHVSAHLESTATDSGITGIGTWDLLLTGSANDEIYGTVGGDYVVGFTLTEPMLYSFSLFGYAGPPEDWPGRMTAIFSGPGWNITQYWTFDRGPMLFAAMPPQGVLTAGSYQIYVGFFGEALEGFVDISGPSHTSGRMNLNLELTPVAVPDPASLLLVGSGLLALHRCRRRRPHV